MPGRQVRSSLQPRAERAWRSARSSGVASPTAAVIRRSAGRRRARSSTPLSPGCARPPPPRCASAPAWRYPDRSWSPSSPKPPAGPRPGPAEGRCPHSRRPPAPPPRWLTEGRPRHAGSGPGARPTAHRRGPADAHRQRLGLPDPREPFSISMRVSRASICPGSTTAPRSSWAAREKPPCRAWKAGMPGRHSPPV